MSAHPQQPLVVAADGVTRFLPNAIVRYLCDKYEFLNEVSVMEFSDEDHRQIAQLLGYSASGYGDLSYVSEEHADEVDAQAAALRAAPGTASSDPLSEIRARLAAVDVDQSKVVPYVLALRAAVADVPRLLDVAEEVLSLHSVDGALQSVEGADRNLVLVCKECCLSWPCATARAITTALGGGS